MVRMTSYLLLSVAKIASCLTVPPSAYPMSIDVARLRPNSQREYVRPGVSYTDSTPVPGDFKITWSSPSVPLGQASSFNISGSPNNDFNSSIVYAWFQGFDAYGEPAVFFAAPGLPASDGGDLVRIVNFKIMDPGLYEMHIMLHRGSYNGFAHGNEQSNRPLLAAPVRFVVADDTNDNKDAQTVAIRMPPSTCNGVNGNGEGRWVRCDLSGEQNCLRDGWRYVNHNCKFNIYTPDQILAASHPKFSSLSLSSPWIVVMGTSIIRGTLHTMLDYVGEGKVSAHHSKPIPDRLFTGYDRPGEGSTTKCWGWSDVQLGGLRMSYQDARFAYSRAEDYAAGMWNRVAKVFAEGPTIVRMEIELIIPDDISTVFSLMNRTGYNGIVLLSVTKPRFLGSFLDKLKPPGYETSIAQYISSGEEQFPHLRNRVVHQDETYMGWAALFDAEHPLDYHESSQHFHRYRLEGGQGRRLYGIAAEMSAMMIINVLIESSTVNANTRQVESISMQSNTLPAKMCVSCPAIACCNMSSKGWLPPQNPTYTLSDPVFTMSDDLHGCTLL